MECREAKIKDREQLAAIWRKIFGDSEEFCHWFYTERWLPECSVVVEDDGKIVSVFNGYMQSLNLRGKPFPAAMLCGVSTLPEYRGRGLVYTCMEQYTKQVTALGASVIYHTPANIRVYHGMQHYVNNDAAYVRRTETAVCKPSSPYQLHACEDSLAPELNEKYNRCIGRYSGAVLRTETDMLMKLRSFARFGGSVLTLDAPYEGYALCFSEEKELICSELAADDKYARDALLLALADYAGSQQLKVKLPTDFAYDLPEGFCAQLAPAGVMYPTDPKRLLRELCGAEDVHLNLNGLSYDFAGNRTDAPADIEMNSGHLMQLLSGYRTLRELYDEKNLVVNNLSVIERLDALLPKYPCFTADEY